MREFIILVCVPVGFVVIAALISTWFDKLRDNNRRKKHPLYFEAYDEAMKICFAASAKVRHDVECLKHQFDMLTEGLREGECTVEYFRKRFEYLANRHVETTKWFKEQQAEAEKLFRQADSYAKRNNLLWGVLY